MGLQKCPILKSSPNSGIFQATVSNITGFLFKYDSNRIKIFFYFYWLLNYRKFSYWIRNLFGLYIKPLWSRFCGKRVQNHLKYMLGGVTEVENSRLFFRKITQNCVKIFTSELACWISSFASITLEQLIAEKIMDNVEIVFTS